MTVRFLKPGNRQFGSSMSLTPFIESDAGLKIGVIMPKMRFCLPKKWEKWPDVVIKWIHTFPGRIFLFLSSYWLVMKGIERVYLIPLSLISCACEQPLSVSLCAVANSVLPETIPMGRPKKLIELWRTQRIGNPKKPLMLSGRKWSKRIKIKFKNTRIPISQA